jgi:hypothetical protein
VALLTLESREKKEKTVIDYAHHLIKMEFMTRVVHDACLCKNYTGARDITVELLAETKLLLNTLTLMQDEQARIEAERFGHRVRVQP